MLQADDVGHRVVVRRSAGVGQHGRTQHTDVLGHLLAIDDQQLIVRADDGAAQTIALTEVAAAKRIGPRPPRYSEMVALERVADLAWLAPEREPLGEWILRAAAGFTNRANSALPLGDPGRPLDEAIDACVDWYRARALTPRITVPLPVRRDVAAALSQRGWHAQPPVLVQTAALADVRANAPTGVPARLDRQPSVRFLGIISARKGGLPEAAHRVLSAGEVRFAEIAGSADVAGEPAPNTAVPDAIARGAVVDGWLHLGLVEVDASARGRGLARAITQALVSWATEAGATRALLQVEEQNQAAVRLYASMGFGTHHRYVTYRAPN